MAQPKSSMGSRRLVETCAVVWMDLLGYGSMLRDVGFDPTEKQAKEAIARLGQFQDCIAKHSSKLLPSVVMNDGVALYRDLSPRTKSVTLEFLNSAWELHKDINRIEHAQGYPGVRSIAAAGFRVRRKTKIRNHLVNGIGAHLVAQAEAGEIPIKQAILTALTIRPHFDITPELQANFAFSKAYLAESDGSKKGFKGSNMFVDHAFFESDLPEWMMIGSPVKWETSGLATTFSPLENIDFEKAKDAKYVGVLDAFEVAENLVESEEIVKRLKNLTVNKKLQKI